MGTLHIIPCCVLTLSSGARIKEPSEELIDSRPITPLVKLYLAKTVLIALLLPATLALTVKPLLGESQSPLKRAPLPPALVRWHQLATLHSANPKVTKRKPLPPVTTLTSLMPPIRTAHHPSRITAENLTASGRISCELTASQLEKQLVMGFPNPSKGPNWSYHQAEKTLQVLNNSHRLGLKKQKYCLHDIANIISDWDNTATTSREFVLNLAVSRILLHQRYGIINASKYVDQIPGFLVFFHALGAELQQALESLEPSSPTYPSLLAELSRLEELAESGGLPTIALERGTASGASVEHFLVANGDLRTYTTLPPNEETVIAAIKRYQFQHGLLVDGIVGRKTLASMQTPVSVYIDQILATLERIRTDTYSPAPKSIIVNIPAFTVYGLSSGKTALTSRAIVGTQKTQTIPFHDVIEYIYINPSWHIPRSILKGELIHELRENPAELASRDILIVTEDGYRDVRTVDWNLLSPEEASKYKLVQRPGPNNPLGNLKIIFPNEHQIYLHDTPFKHLFNNPVRKFSHGCVRLEQAYDLASFILRKHNNTEKEQFTTAEIAALVASKKRKVIRVDPPVPVYLVYHTVDAWGDAPPRFLDDAYGLNKALIAALKAS